MNNYDFYRNLRENNSRINRALEKLGFDVNVKPSRSSFRGGSVPKPRITVAGQDVLNKAANKLPKISPSLTKTISRDQGMAEQVVKFIDAGRRNELAEILQALHISGGQTNVINQVMEHIEIFGDFYPKTIAGSSNATTVARFLTYIKNDLKLNTGLSFDDLFGSRDNPL